VSPVEIRPARAGDVDFLAGLLSDEDVEPFLAGGRPRDREALLAEIRRMEEDPVASGRLVIELDGEPVGAMAYDRVNERNRIAHLHGLAVSPAARGRGVAADAARQLQRRLFGELGYHRLQLECYGFNERAIRHAERVGFVREGVKRQAYLRHGDWVDGIMFGLLAEDLGSR